MLAKTVHSEKPQFPQSIARNGGQALPKR
jgi:hypothetical protein